MSNVTTQSVLFQYSAMVNASLPGAKLTHIRPLPAGVSVYSVYGDAFTALPNPTADENCAPTSILARTPPAQAAETEIDWNELLLNPPNYEAAMDAIRRAGELKDPRAIPALIDIASDEAGWWIQNIDDVTHHVNAAYEAIVSIGGRSALLGLISIMRGTLSSDDRGETFHAKCYAVSSVIEDLADAGTNCRKAIPFLLAWLENGAGAGDEDDLFQVSNTLRKIGGAGIKNRFIQSLQNNPYVGRNPFMYEALAEWEIPHGEIEAIMFGRPHADGENLIEDPVQRTAYRIIAGGVDAKRSILGDSAVLNALSTPQAWITINDPQLAREGLELVAARARSKRGRLENVLKAELGVRIKDIEDAHYTFYADEILDAVAQFVKGSELQRDTEVQAVISRIRYGDDIKLRYVRRDISDTSLGSRCGDCTAKGSIHFGDSMTWFINPAYQIIKMSKGKRFIGKINITLGTFGREDAIIIDALEFNPQAQKGKPYYKDGVACFTEAMTFLKELARRQNRQLIALRTSNSSGALEMLRGWGEWVSVEGENIGISLLIPHGEMQALLKQHDYAGEVNLYYQMLGEAERALLSKGSHDMIHDKLPSLEREVINPAQQANEDVAAAMRERDFNLAAKHIMANSDWNAQVKSIFSIPLDLKLSPEFLAKRLKDMYRDDAVDIEDLKKGFIVPVSNFLRIPLD